MLKNLSPGTVLLIGALSLAVGWYAGSSGSSNQLTQDAAATRPRTGPRPLGSSVNAAPLTRKLQERLDTQPPRTPAVGRNPFVFGSRRAPSVVRQAEEPMAAAVAAAPVPVVPPAPQFKLSGIASEQQDGATVWTAILIDNGSLAFVKAGDRLSNGYSVVRVEETGVVIVDAAGITQTLRLP
jgi:hypothetical protein